MEYVTNMPKKYAGEATKATIKSGRLCSSSSACTLNRNEALHITIYIYIYMTLYQTLVPSNNRMYLYINKRYLEQSFPRSKMVSEFFILFSTTIREIGDLNL